MVTHNLYPCAGAQKFELLHALLDDTHYESVIIFCRMKIGAGPGGPPGSWATGHKVAALHSDRSQSEREEALAGFRDGKIRGCSSPPTSRRAGWTLPESRTSSISTCRSIQRITSTASGAQAVLRRRGMR